MLLSFKLSTLKSKTFWVSVSLGIWQGIGHGMGMNDEAIQTGNEILMALIGICLADRLSKTAPPSK